MNVMLSLLLGGPVLAWWPGRMPAPVRKAAAVLALVPVVAVFVFAAVLLVSRPRQLAWPVLPLLAVFGAMIPAGAYALWPGGRGRTRVAAGVAFVGSLLGLVAMALAVLYARGGTVVGKVTFNGQPVPAGKVSILSEGGIVCSGDISPTGRYVVYRVPPGPVKIAVAAYPPPRPGPVPVTA